MPLPVQILVSVSLLLVDFKLGRSVIPPDNVYVQYWQVLMVLFLLLKLYHELDAGVAAAVEVGCEFIHLALLDSLHIIHILEPGKRADFFWTTLKGLFLELFTEGGTCSWADGTAHGKTVGISFL